MIVVRVDSFFFNSAFFFVFFQKIEMLFCYITKSIIQNKNNKMESIKCEHKFPCGCDKKRCEECEEYWLENDDDRGVECEDEDCCEYYRYRNDNCNCGGCGYCSGEGYAEAEETETEAEEEEDIECVRCNEMCGVDDIVCCDGCSEWFCYDCEELQTIENDNDDNRAYCQECWNQKKKE